MTKRVYINDYEMCCSAGLTAENSFLGLISRDFNYNENSLWQGFSLPDPSNTQDDAANLDVSGALKIGPDRTLKLLDIVKEHLSEEVTDNLDKEKTGVIIASSRGATETLEKAIVNHHTNRALSPKTSPYTTAGVLSSKLAQDLNLSGGSFSVSSACTSSLNSIGTAFHLIRSGLFESCLAGGTEAPLTSFTHKMLERAKVTSKKDTPYPLQSFGSEENNKGMVLGEAAGICTLSQNKTESSIAEILSFSMASESQGLTGLSENADSLMKSINTSIQDANLKKGEIDLIVCHGSGTLKGDKAEFNAYKKVFEDDLPRILITKWATGHTLGSAGVLSIGFALKAAEHDKIPAPPYPVFHGIPGNIGKSIRHILITGLGFGGGASSIVLKII